MVVPYKINKTLLLENKIPLTCMMKRGKKITNITSPYMMEEYEVIYDCPSETYPVVMEDCVKDEHDGSIRNNFIEENDT